MRCNYPFSKIPQFCNCCKTLKLLIDFRLTTAERKQVLKRKAAATSFRNLLPFNSLLVFRWSVDSFWIWQTVVDGWMREFYITFTLTAYQTATVQKLQTYPSYIIYNNQLLHITCLNKFKFLLTLCWSSLLMLEKAGRSSGEYDQHCSMMLWNCHKIILNLLILKH